MFIQRNASGEIIAISETPSAEFNEHANADSDEFLSFLKRAGTKSLDPLQSLQGTDTELVRVLEDLVALLTDKGVIQFTDLPLAAQQKLLSRQTLRHKNRSLDLLDDEDQEPIDFV